MPTEIHVPALGESVVDAIVASWNKREGEAVKRGEVLGELETDKVNREVAAEQDGVLEKIVKQEGGVVPEGEVLCLLGTGSAPEPVTAPQAAAVPELVRTASRPL